MSAFTTIAALDVAILRACNVWMGRAPRFDALVEVFADNDIVKGGLLIGLLWWFWHQSHRDQATRRQVIIATIAGALVAALVSRSLANLFPFRMRPVNTPALGFIAPSPERWMENHGSFPSDHAALAMGLAAGLLSLSPRLGVPVIAYVIVFVCLPRLYLGLHWPSDLIAGALLGWVATTICCLPRVRPALAAGPLRLLSRAPAWFYVAMFFIMFGLMTRFDDARALARWGASALRDGQNASASERISGAFPVRAAERGKR